jgi:hypothetical protein
MDEDYKKKMEEILSRSYENKPVVYRNCYTKEKLGGPGTNIVTNFQLPEEK